MNVGFDIESEDEAGNTLLIIAVQQLQVRLVAGTSAVVWNTQLITGTLGTL